MSLSALPMLVIVPGLRDHVPDHWQTVLADKIADARTVPPLEQDRLSRDAQVAALNEVLSDVSGPVLLVAHSAGVMTAVHWAAQRHRRPVKGALLATPPDFVAPLPDGFPTPEALRENGWTPTPRTPLPFPSIDQSCRSGAVKAAATQRGSRARAVRGSRAGPVPSRPSGPPRSRQPPP
ncbi:RBBP9/YdeN family alpha/beta hydrolase [Streptomyces sp. NPDC093149]|uniref:RBBP9/YdeN family alpha/beta hydrolase n=1 Tax=Streptomyces sp. NPDC093149 TaxID=3366031 RepID=UPI00382C80DE